MYPKGIIIAIRVKKKLFKLFTNRSLIIEFFDSNKYILTSPEIIRIENNVHEIKRRKETTGFRYFSQYHIKYL